MSSRGEKVFAPFMDRAALRSSAPRIPLGAGVGTWLWCWLAAQALAAPIVITWGPTGDENTAVWLVAVTSLLAWALYLLGMAFISRRAGSGRFVDDYGLRFRRWDVAGLGVGVVVQLAIVPLVYVPLQLWWPDAFTDDRLQDTAKSMVDSAHGGWLVVLTLTVAVGAPLVEELVYRGLIQRSMSTRVSDGVAWVATAALFTLIHFRPYEYPGLFAFSLAVGAAAMWTRRLGLSVMIHVGFNATGLALAYV